VQRLLKKISETIEKSSNIREEIENKTTIPFHFSSKFTSVDFK